MLCCKTAVFLSTKKLLGIFYKNSLSHSMYTYLDSKPLAVIYLWYIRFFLVHAQKSLAHVALPKWPIYQFKPVHQSTQHALIFYCPNTYCDFLSTRFSKLVYLVKNKALPVAQMSPIWGHEGPSESQFCGAQTPGKALDLQVNKANIFQDTYIYVCTMQQLSLFFQRSRVQQNYWRIIKEFRKNLK